MIISYQKRYVYASSLMTKTAFLIDIKRPINHNRIESRFRGIYHAKNGSFNSIVEMVKQKDEPKLKIWFTADDKKIPVKIQLQKGIISFIFYLVLLPG